MDVSVIQAIAEKYRGMTTAPLGFGFYDLNNGESVFLNGERHFPMASVFKIFVLIELMRMVERGEADLDERITLDAKDYTEGSGLLKCLRPGFSLTLADYAYLMMSFSDNTATDVVIRYATVEKVNEDLLKPFGFADTKVDMNCSTLLHAAYTETAGTGECLPNGHKSYRNAPYFTCSKEKNLESTPRDLVRALTMLYKGELVGPEGTAMAIKIMKACALNQRIPLALPPHVDAAHKTGSLDRVANDAGIIYTDEGAYALVLMYNGNCADWAEYRDNLKAKTGNGLLSALSGDIYKAYTAIQSRCQPNLKVGG